jgi:hypothetical protein
MAESKSWISIRDHGLLSTTALLDRYDVNGERREQIEARRRPNSVLLERANMPQAIVRDQLPMDDKGLLRCLPSNITPADWYRLLNSRVFFWLTRERLFRLLGADAYRNLQHDVLEVDTKKLVDAYAERIWLCPMNSGCTKPFPHPRGKDTFLRIGDYPYLTWRKKRPRGERVVELCVDQGVSDIRDFVIRVVEMTGDREVNVVFER